MAAYVQFYLNRGAVAGVQVIPAASIDRMETPTRTWEARQGLKAGYGLSNYTEVHDGFVYHGHNGGVDGGLTHMSYMPEHGVGVFYSINSGHAEAFGKIGDAIRAYITRSLTRPPCPPPAGCPSMRRSTPVGTKPAAPRNELTHFLERLVGLTRVRFEGGKLLLTRIGALNRPAIPVSGGQFRSVPEKEHPSPIATVALLAPSSEGRFVLLGGTMRQVPTWLALAEIGLTAFFLLAVLAILLYAPFWMVGGLIRRRRRPAERATRVWPLVAATSLLAFALLVIIAGDDVVIARLGNLTSWSFGIFLSTIVLAVASLASAVAVWRARTQEVRRSVRWFSTTVTAALLVGAVYLAWWGVIGIRTWN